METRPLWPFQRKAVESTLQAWYHGHRRNLLVAPTGAGKTRMGLELVRAARSRGRRVLWLVHRNELRKQAARVLGEGLGGLDGIEIATVQTLSARDERPAAGLVVLDEAHHYVSDDWGVVAQDYESCPVLGLTATPERSDGRSLGDLFEHMVVAATYPELVAGGYLVPAKVFRPGEALPRGLAQEPLEAYRAYGEDGQAFLFAGSVTLAIEWASAFNHAGISAAVIEQSTPEAEREDILRRFSSGELRVLTNVYVLTEGVDVPAASVCILARKIGHQTPYLQMVGRVLRRAEGKRHGVVIDLAGNSFSHGLPTEAREYSLEDGIKRQPEGAGSLRVCVRCGFTFEGAPKCPRCGFVAAAKKKPRPTIYDMALQEVYAGGETPEPAKSAELSRLVAQAKERGWSFAFVAREYRSLFGHMPRAHEVPVDLRRSEWKRLVAQAEERGYQRGWAYHRYRAMFGEQPRRDW